MTSDSTKSIVFGVVVFAHLLAVVFAAIGLGLTDWLVFDVRVQVPQQNQTLIEHITVGLFEECIHVQVGERHEAVCLDYGSNSTWWLTISEVFWVMYFIAVALSFLVTVFGIVKNQLTIRPSPLNPTVRTISYYGSDAVLRYVNTLRILYGSGVTSAAVVLAVLGYESTSMVIPLVPELSIQGLQMTLGSSFVLGVISAALFFFCAAVNEHVVLAITANSRRLATGASRASKYGEMVAPLQAESVV